MMVEASLVMQWLVALSSVMPTLAEKCLGQLLVSTFHNCIEFALQQTVSKDSDCLQTPRIQSLSLPVY